MLRQTAVNFLLLSLLFVSFIFIILAQAEQARFRSQVPQLSTCNTALPAIAFGLPITVAGQLAGGVSLPSASLQWDKTNSACLTPSARLHWVSSGSTAITYPGALDSCLDDCFDPSNFKTCRYNTFDNRSFVVSQSQTVACYCSNALATEVQSKDLFSGAVKVYNEDGIICAQVASNFVTYNAFALVSSIITTIINWLLQYILGWLTAYEGHPSLSAQERAISFKVFVSLYLNTAVIVLLINAAL